MSVTIECENCKWEIDRKYFVVHHLMENYQNGQEVVMEKQEECSLCKKTIANGEKAYVYTRQILKDLGALPLEIVNQLSEEQVKNALKKVKDPEEN